MEVTETSGRDRGWAQVGESKLAELLRRQRRRIERVPVEWEALYGPEATPSLRCRVLDVSIAGAQLELVDDPGGDFDCVFIELRAPERTLGGVVLRGEVRNFASNNARRVMGIEFVGTTNRTRLVLAELIARYG
jgi:hypothetical protein